MGSHAQDDQRARRRAQPARTRGRRRATADPDTGARTRRRAMAVAVPLGLLASGALVLQTSSAAFTATTDSPNVTWGTGTVSLTNNGTNATDLTFSNIKPADPRTFCILVSYTGSLAAHVSLYSATAAASVLTSAGSTGSSSTNLDSQLQLTVDALAGNHTTSPNTCAGTAGSATAVPLTAAVTNETVKAFATNRTGYSTGTITQSSLATNTLVTYRVTYVLPDTASNNDAQGDQIRLTLRWEAKNA